ncbi:MAG TPA: hypothetical protein PKZ53_20500, partial [Acidobacteriota bacterium]|nr:hypothetical protein [Acidobacteriota bacterium]
MSTRYTSLCFGMSLLIGLFILKPMVVPGAISPGTNKLSQDEFSPDEEDSPALRRCAAYKSPEEIEAEEKEFSAKMISLSKSGAVPGGGQ